MYAVSTGCLKLLFRTKRQNEAIAAFRFALSTRDVNLKILVEERNAFPTQFLRVRSFRVEKYVAHIVYAVYLLFFFSSFLRNMTPSHVRLVSLRMLRLQLLLSEKTAMHMRVYERGYSRGACIFHAPL